MTTPNMIGIEITGRGPWMQTGSGLKFYPLDPSAFEVEMLDVARGLAHQGRFTGQGEFFLSIAQHSILVERLISARYGVGERALRRAALMHDAPEAYIGDMNRPLKSSMTEYRAAEAKVWSAVAERFGLLPDLPPEVKEADEQALLLEKALLFPGVAAWPNSPDPWPEVETWQIVPLAPGTAYRAFIEAARELFPEDPAWRKTA